MFGIEDYTESLRKLWQETKGYLELQKEYLTLDAAEKLIVLLSAAALGAICLVIGAMALFFLLFALAAWVGQLSGSVALGFLIMGVVLLLLMATVYFKRKAWIIQPLARLVVGLFVRDDEEEEAV
ncbi:MAG: phage holin family protein [Bacteroidaceae bacterium]|nr:phage holin family protein [Bacteroidaceae bacterium]